MHDKGGQTPLWGLTPLACDVGNLFDDKVQGLGEFSVCCFVKHFFSVPPGSDQACVFQQSQVVGDCGTCHVYDGCDIYDAFLRVTQEPEDSETGRVSQFLHGVSHRADGVVIWHDVRKFLTGQGIAMDMW